jgi:putative ABC transport system permease protein
VSNAEPPLSPALVVVCVVMAVAGVRAAIQLAGVALVLAAAMMRLWSSVVVLAVMFVVASATAARRSEADHGSPWLATALAIGMAAVIPLLLVSRVV